MPPAVWSVPRMTLVLTTIVGDTILIATDSAVGHPSGFRSSPETRKCRIVKHRGADALLMALFGDFRAGSPPDQWLDAFESVRADAQSFAQQTADICRTLDQIGLWPPPGRRAGCLVLGFDGSQPTCAVLRCDQNGGPWVLATLTGPSIVAGYTQHTHITSAFDNDSAQTDVGWIEHSDSFQSREEFLNWATRRVVDAADCLQKRGQLGCIQLPIQSQSLQLSIPRPRSTV